MGLSVSRGCYFQNGGSDGELILFTEGNEGNEDSDGRTTDGIISQEHLRLNRTSFSLFPSVHQRLFPAVKSVSIGSRVNFPFSLPHNFIARNNA